MTSHCVTDICGVKGILKGQELKQTVSERGNTLDSMRKLFWNIQACKPILIVTQNKNSEPENEHLSHLNKSLTGDNEKMSFSAASQK